MRAGATCVAYVDGDRTTVRDCRPTAGFGKSIVYVTRRSRAGRISSFLPPDAATDRTRDGAYTARRAARGAKPARSNASSHGSALPSRIGTSGPSISTRRLSSPAPTTAERRCSTVLTSRPRSPSDVAWSKRPAASAMAGTNVPTSVRWNTMPWSGPAGLRTTWTCRPLCRPIPEIRTGRARVDCTIIVRRFAWRVPRRPPYFFNELRGCRRPMCGAIAARAAKPPHPGPAARRRSRRRRTQTGCYPRRTHGGTFARA